MSALSIEPNNGVRLKLANYFLIRTSQTGGEFWSHENQQIIRQSMGDFLPKAEQDGSNSVLFQHFVDGREACSNSLPIGPSNPLDPAELARVKLAVATLKQKAADPHCDPNARKFIESFRLPDPVKDPELYRIYGSSGKRKLIVLWGLEKEEGTAVGATDAINRIPVSTNSGGGWMKWAATAAVLLLALLLALFFLKDKTLQSAGQEIADQNSSTADPNSADSTSQENQPAGTSDGNNPLATPAPDGTSALGQSPAAAPSSTPQAPSVANTSVQGEPVPVESGAPRPSAGVPGAEPVIPGSDPGAAPANPTASSPAGTPPAPLSDSPAADPTKEPSSLMADAEEKPKDDAISPPHEPTNPPPSTPGEEKPKGPTSSTTKKSKTLPDPAPGPLPGDKPAAATAGMPSSGNPPAVPQQPPALTGEIVNGRTNTTPKDGKVEMLLSLLARDTDGNPVTIAKVHHWTVGGKTQTDSSGKSVNVNGLPLLLAEGTHSVSVRGVSEDGRTVDAEAEIGVNIAIRQESSVRLKQHPITKTPTPTPEKK
jgi:hypothetical protein